MKILIIPSEFPTISRPGSGTFIMDQTKILADGGFDVTVLYHDQLSPIEALNSKSFCSVKKDKIGRLTTIISTGLNIPKLSEKLFVRGIDNLLQNHTNNDFDIIHAHFCVWSGICAKYISDKYKIPYIVTEHSSSFPRGQYNKYKLKKAREVFLKSSKNIVPSKFLESAICKEIEKKINFLIVSNPVTIKDPKISKYEKTTAICISNLIELKSIDLIIKSLAKSGTDINLNIAGDGPELDSLKELVIALKIEDRVKFLGRIPRDQVAVEFSKSHFFCHASKFETFGIVVAESLFFGLPVICTRCGAPESFLSEENSILVDVDDENAYVEAFKKMNKSMNKFDRDAIIKRVKDEFGTNVFLEKHRQIYEELFKSR